jgi:hypothetical protein
MNKYTYLDNSLILIPIYCTNGLATHPGNSSPG